MMALQSLMLSGSVRSLSLTVPLWDTDFGHLSLLGKLASFLWFFGFFLGAIFPLWFLLGLGHPSSCWSYFVKPGHPSFWVPCPSGFNFFIMRPNYMGRSADLKVGNFPEGTTDCDIAKSIVGHFTAENIKVLSIQQCAYKIACVTFEDKMACEIIHLRGELDMGGVRVPVVPPPLPPP